MKLSKNVLSLLFAAAGIAAAIFLANTALFNGMELDSIDMRFRLKGGGSIDPRLKLIAIDDTSIDRIGKFPWRRVYYAQILQALSNFGPSCAALDIILAHSDEKSIDDDRTLAEIMKLMKSALLSYYFSFDECLEVSGGVLPPPLSNVKGDIGLLPPATGVVLPAPPYEGIERLGFINTPKDPSSPLGKGLNADGVIREVPLIIRYGSNVYPSLSLEAVRIGLGMEPSDIFVEIGKSVSIRTPGDSPVERRFPIDEKGMMMVNYAAPCSGFDFNPFEEVLDEFSKYARGEAPDFDLGKFQNAIVFVGATATGLDSGQTPLHRHSPLIAVHLNAVNTMLTGECMVMAPCVVNLALAVGVGLLAWFFAYRLPYVAGALALVLAAAVYIGAAAAIFNICRVVLAVVSPVLCLVCATMTTTAFRLVVVDREKRWVKRALSHYVTREVMEEIMRNPAALELGGARKELTVLFSDIKGFTTFCEGHAPEEVVARLNEYMDEMTEAIFNHGGTLDKYVGDEIVAIFGAPRDERSAGGGRCPKEDAKNAVLAALEMRERLAALQDRWRSRGLEVWEMGIGINTGEMIVGNMGSRMVMDYTVIGDEVNLGARVEGLTRTYDAPILITGPTYEYVKDTVRVEKVGDAKVKGRDKPVTVYKVTGLLKKQ